MKKLYVLFLAVACMAGMHTAKAMMPAKKKKSKTASIESVRNNAGNPIAFLWVTSSRMGGKRLNLELIQPGQELFFDDAVKLKKSTDAILFQENGGMVRINYHNGFLGLNDVFTGSSESRLLPGTGLHTLYVAQASPQAIQLGTSELQIKIDRVEDLIRALKQGNYLGAIGVLRENKRLFDEYKGVQTMREVTAAILRKDYRRVFELLGADLEDAPVATLAEVQQSPLFKLAVKNLKKDLESQNVSQARARLRFSRDMLEAGLGAELLAQVEQAVGASDFDRALELLSDEDYSSETEEMLSSGATTPFASRSTSPITSRSTSPITSTGEGSESGSTVE